MCKNQASYKFTWPGEDESLICEKHVEKLKGISKAMGFHLQIISLSQDNLKKKLICQQK